MRYKILKRILRGQRTIGYQLLCESGGTVNISKEQTLEAAKKGLIVNATYNRRTNSLSGTLGTDLRSLPVLKYHKPENNKITPNEKRKTNHQMAKEFLNKCKILGKNILAVELLPDDRVKLIKVLDEESTGSFRLPDFITDFGPPSKLEHSGVDYYGPFNNCNFSSINIGKIGVLPIDTLSKLFQGTLRITELDLSKIDSSKVISMVKMFNGCKGLKKLDLRGFDFSLLKLADFMFSGCTSLESIDFGESEFKSLHSVSNMFNGCKGLKKIDFNKLARHLKAESLEGLFTKCESLVGLERFKCDTSEVWNIDNIFSGCNQLTEIDISWINGAVLASAYGVFSGCENLKKVTFNTTLSNALDLSAFCNGCISLEEVDMSKLRTLFVENMADMFNGCTKLTKVNIRGFRTNAVEEMDRMFMNCSAVRELDLSNFVAYRVMSMESMFSGCTSLEKINLSNFSLIGLIEQYRGEEVKQLVEMCLNCAFDKCDSLREVVCPDPETASLLQEAYRKNNPAGKAKFIVK